MEIRKFFRKNIAITNEHGSWIFLFSPLAIGLFAADSFSITSLYLILASLSLFLIRHPITIVVKALSGRRSRRDIPAALFWVFLYGILCLTMAIGLVIQGYGYLGYLCIPGLVVFVWHLNLVKKRAERRKIGIEIVASGVLALSAPAAYWVGVGIPHPDGWWLWVLTWMQSASSIIYAYLRLEQRSWTKIPSAFELLKAGREAIIIVSVNLGAVISLKLLEYLPAILIFPFLLQFLETIWGAFFRPAAGFKPSKIGFRQLGVSAIFTILFILAWHTSK